METLEQIRERIVAGFPGAEAEVLPNPAVPAQGSLRLGAARAREIARFLRDDPALRLDYCSNVTGVDWPEKEIVETVRTRVPAADGAGEKVIEQKTTRRQPGCLEAVYHLYSMALRHGPVVIRLRTGNRTDQVTLPSLTPVWRACEFQEREIYDLFGIAFEGHPDLRRLLMWDAFQDHPMRKDYVEPDDYEWEPTAHDDVLEKARKHQLAGEMPSAE
jgi:NADH-quinone oxidoreductase subunit C